MKRMSGESAVKTYSADFPGNINLVNESYLTKWFQVKNMYFYHCSWRLYHWMLRDNPVLTRTTQLSCCALQMYCNGFYIYKDIIFKKHLSDWWKHHKQDSAAHTSLGVESTSCSVLMQDCFQSGSLLTYPCSSGKHEANLWGWNLYRLNEMMIADEEYASWAPCPLAHNKL